jgi:hypothetical protein
VGKLDLKTLPSSGSPNPQTPHLSPFGRDWRPAFLSRHYYLTATENIDRAIGKTAFREPIHNLILVQGQSDLSMKLDTYGEMLAKSDGPTQPDLRPQQRTGLLKICITGGIGQHSPRSTLLLRLIHQLSRRPPNERASRERVRFISEIRNFQSLIETRFTRKPDLTSRFQPTSGRPFSDLTNGFINDVAEPNSLFLKIHCIDRTDEQCVLLLGSTVRVGRPTSE